MNARYDAFHILFRFETRRERLDVLLEDRLRQATLNPLDKKLLRNLASGVIRHLSLLDWYIDRFYSGRPSRMLIKLRVILRMAFYELLFLEQIPARATVNEYVNLAEKRLNVRTGKLVNGLLRSYLRFELPLDPGHGLPDTAERLSRIYSFPLWMIRRWLSFWPESRVEDLCRAFNQMPEFDVRVNLRKTSVRAFRIRAADAGLKTRQDKRFEYMFTAPDPQTLLQQGWLEQGLISVQDHSAVIPVEILQPEPGDLVLDMCAAPGGKYTQMLEKADDRVTVVAVDSDRERLIRVRENIMRLGLGRGMLVQADSRHLPFKKPFTKILLDAPCSGLGVIRKHPDIKWRRTEKEVDAFSRLQASLLNSAGRHLAPDGRLVYSTCTIDSRENDAVIKAFLEKSAKTFHLEEIPQKFSALCDDGFIKTYPDLHKMDGSFCAILRKNTEK